MSKLVVLKCLECGDVYPHPEDEAIACPSCGSDRAEVAGEPLL